MEPELTANFGDDVLDKHALNFPMIDNSSELELDDLEEQEAVHDQLPPVDACKINMDAPATSGRRCTGISCIFLVVVGISNFLAIIFLSIRNSSENQVAMMEFHDKTEEVVQFLLKHKVAPEPELRMNASPQRRAAQFIADGDAYRMAYTEENAARFIDRYVLTVLWYQFGGHDWIYQLNFMSASDVCEWHTRFTTVNGDTIREGVLCDENGRVKKLMLAYNGIQGQDGVPMELKSLDQLDTFHMHYNQKMSGGFPEAFRHMPKLTSIGLHYCGFQGNLPEWIGEMTQLSTLALSNNQLYGSVPSSIQNLRNLKFLALDGNTALEGNVNLFGDMSNLEILYLEDNIFTGQLEGLVEHWPKLRELDVGNNKLDGPVTSALLTLPNMVVLDLHHNFFDGYFPDDIFQNTKLEYLALHDNLIGGSISDRVGFLESIKHIDISYNRLTGTIPDTVSGLTNLVYLATGGNDFGAQQLPDMSQCSHLRDLSMKGNNLIGSIPDYIGLLSNLQLLDLDDNGLTGTIPSWVGVMTSLDHLLLNMNALVGSIPSQMAALVHLKVLLLDRNSITGNADVICNSAGVKPEIFISDCYPGTQGEAPEIECRCCTKCCADGDDSCNNKTWTSNVDPSWEYGLTRSSYRFSLQNAPAAYAQDREDENQSVDPLM